MRSPGLGQGRQRLVGHPAIKSARSALLKFNDDGAAGRRSADAATYFQRALRRAVGSFWQAPIPQDPRGAGVRWTPPDPDVLRRLLGRAQEAGVMRLQVADPAPLTICVVS